MPAGRRPRAMSAIDDGDWKRLYPWVRKLHTRCPLLWGVWRHQQGADADVLIEQGQLVELSAELQILKATVPASERQQVESLTALCEEAATLGFHIAFVAD